MQVWPESIDWFCIQSADKAHFHNLSNVVTFERGPMSPKFNQVFYLFKLYNKASLVWIHEYILEIVCRQVVFSSKYDFLSACIGSRSPKLNHSLPISQWRSHASLVRIHWLVLQRLIFAIRVMWWPLKMESRSPKFNQVFHPFQLYNLSSLV